MAHKCDYIDHVLHNYLLLFMSTWPQCLQLKFLKLFIFISLPTKPWFTADMLLQVSTTGVGLYITYLTMANTSDLLFA